MNLVEKLHAEVFIAIHQQRVNMADEKALFAWVASKGVGCCPFRGSLQILLGGQQGGTCQPNTKAYNVPGTPAIVVNGKYLVGQGDHARQLQVTNFLIAKARSEQKK